jgi:hypothetical protein
MRVFGEFISISNLFISNEELSPSTFSEFSRENVPQAPESYKEYEMVYAAMSDEERSHYNPYEGSDDNGREIMRVFAVKLEIGLDYVDSRLNDWIFSEPAQIPFLSDARAIGFTN